MGANSEIAQAGKSGLWGVRSQGERQGFKLKREHQKGAPGQVEGIKKFTGRSQTRLEPIGSDRHLGFKKTAEISKMKKSVGTLTKGGTTGWREDKGRSGGK